MQYHPEADLTERGHEIIRNFLFDICGATGDYSIGDFIEKEIVAIREKVGDKKVVLGISGGVDSAVTAGILERAIPDQAVCVFVDHGMMRKGEGPHLLPGKLVNTGVLPCLKLTFKKINEQRSVGQRR